jgi:hypothetical protein
MTPTYAIDLIKKYGVTGVLFLWLLSVNFKVNKLEEKLYDCYEDQIRAATTRTAHIKRVEVYAVLPNETKIKKA